jgi:hypothetical protein
VSRAKLPFACRLGAGTVPKNPAILN